MTEMTDSRLATRANNDVVIIFHLPNCRLSVAVKVGFPLTAANVKLTAATFIIRGNYYYF